MAKRTVKDIRRSRSSNGEYDERLESILTGMDAHITADAVAFKHMNDNILEINKDLKVLLGSHFFVSTVWKTLTICAGALVTLVTLYLLYLATKH